MPAANKTQPVEDKHRKVLVSPQTDEDKGMVGYAYVNGVTVKFRFGEPTSLRASHIEFLKKVEVVKREHEDYLDPVDKKRKNRVVRRAKLRYKVFELGKDFKLDESVEKIVQQIEGNEDINSPEADI